MSTCTSCASITHSNINSGAVFYSDADPQSKDKCSLCDLIRGLYLEYLTTNLFRIHHPPKMTLKKTTSRHLIKLEADDVEFVSLDAHQCNLQIAQTTLQDTWYTDEVKRALYLHSSHPEGLRRLDAKYVPSQEDNGALSAWADKT